ncbi:TetR family transcriptional regulator [Mycobacterium vulneris]|uniref:TetR/AcrR family transcriptional regulator n=1 Tax=Mycolicibacterium septicum DSM 44393 TaxID=1341646 RepID=A0A7X6MXR6_9MYCO|nr:MULTISPECIES: TetR/AcrR family transcriptional regulator [Mycolicibacterium]MBX8690350.1 TetR family transcriptional regulator [Mycobacterium sp. 20091114027_K0903767]MCP3811304.1 TetR/AcrR family transcriptional regulator [Mycobacteriaceae bacterium Msp059]OCB47899.1 TetR family transcriptional regulator [Mycolicibacterium vulneris]NKZ14924.1 TetR/AcrR family transcriptional regulator [Mycolicibacterium septicum DSM 44393]OBK07195.1 TetR family transcriptional regulator [Mycolicibacterium 
MSRQSSGAGRRPRPEASDGGAAPKSERTRTRILDAAAQVLSRNGYAGFRLHDVAAAADVRVPAIYYYYESREDLIESVVLSGIREMLEYVTAALDELPSSTSPLERITAAVDAHLRHVLEISFYATAWIRTAGQMPHSVRKRQILEEERYAEIWRQLIDDLARANALRPEMDAQVVRMLVLGALNWTVEWWSPRRVTLDTVVANAQAMICHGILSPHARVGASPP